jgi:hypothetical protein
MKALFLTCRCVAWLEAQYCLTPRYVGQFSVNTFIFQPLISKMPQLLIVKPKPFFPQIRVRQQGVFKIAEGTAFLQGIGQVSAGF